MSNLRQKILDCVSLQKNIKYLTIIFLKYQVQTDTVLGKLVCVQQRSWKQYTAPYSNNSARTSLFYDKEVVSEYLIYSENETQSKIFGLDFFFLIDMWHQYDAGTAGTHHYDHYDVCTALQCAQMTAKYLCFVGGSFFGCCSREQQPKKVAPTKHTYLVKKS